MEDSLKKRYSIKLLSSLINGMISMLLVAIVPKALGPVAFGQFSYLQQFFSQVLAFLDAGTSVAFFTKLSARHERKELITFYFIFSFLLLVILYIFIDAIDIFDYSSKLLPDIPQEYIFYGLWFGFITWLTQIYIKISDAYALTSSVELIKILHKVISLALLVSLISYFTFDLEVYFYFHYFSLVSFILIISLLFIKKDIFSYKLFTMKIIYKKLIQEFYRFSSPLFVFNVVAVFVALFDIWLLQYVSGSIQTGYYGFAYSIAAMCFIFTGAMTPIIMREFSKSYEIKDMKKIRTLFKRYVPMLYSIAAYFGVFIAFESENLIGIFADEKFKDAYVVLMIMAFYPIHQTYGQLSGSLFFAMEKTKLYRNIGLVTSLVGLVLSFLFLYYWELGAIGFAWKMLLIQIVSVNMQLYYNSKLLEFKIIPFLLHQFLSVCFFIIMAFIATHLCFSGNNGIMTLFAQGSIYTLLSFIGIIIFPYIVASNRYEFKLIKNKLNMTKKVK